MVLPSIKGYLLCQFSGGILVIAELWPMDFAKFRLCVDFRKLNPMDLHLNVAKSCLLISSFSFNPIHLILGMNVNQKLQICKT